MLEAYKELLAEIDIHLNLYDSFETSFNYWNDKVQKWKPKELGAQQYSDMPHASKDLPDTITVMCKVIEFKNLMDEEKKILDRLQLKKKLIDDTMEVMDITVKVGRLRAMGLTQEQVAELVDRSTRQVQNIEKKLKENA